MTELDKIMLLLRRSTGISSEVSREIVRLYSSLFRNIDLSLSFSVNSKIINEIYKSIDLKDLYFNKMIGLGSSAVLSAKTLKPIKITKTLINTAFKTIIPDSNISVEQAIMRTKNLSSQSVSNFTLQAINNGWTNKQLRNSLTQSKGQVLRQVDAIANTATSAVLNETRRQLYEKNSDNIDRVMYVATLDGRTSTICKNLDGKVFFIDEFPWPPNHINCRSTGVNINVGESINDVEKRLLPRPQVIPKGRDEMEEKGFRNRNGTIRKPSKSDRSPLKGETTNARNYESWLRSQPEYYQKEILGVKGTELFRNGESLKKVTNVSGITEELLNKSIN